jgi:hypothetical protein
MCHPFPVSRSHEELTAPYLMTQKAIIHNGVLFAPRYNTGFSDTAIFAKWNAVFNKKLKHKLIKRHIGTDRLAVVTPEKVTLFGVWSERDGVHYSNLYSITETVRTYAAPVARVGRSVWANGDLLDSPADRYETSTDDFLSFNEELDWCPRCGSDRTEYIGAKTLTFECLDCHTVYNEMSFLEDYTLNTAYSEEDR